MDIIKKTKMMVGKMGNMWVWAKPDEEPTPIEKIAIEKKDKALNEKVESRADSCWAYGCTRHPLKWVREVQFDVYERGARINKAAVSSEDYAGPIPGFCFGHVGTGPSDLAKSVYHDRPEVAWGFRPTRYVVIFTDGTKEIGDIMSIVPKAPVSVVTDTHIIAEN